MKMSAGDRKKKLTLGLPYLLFRFVCTNFGEAWRLAQGTDATDLLSVDELAVLDGSKCILQLRGVRPFLSSKYDLTKHPNYYLTGDCDKKNLFDIEKFLNRQMKLRADDCYELIDADTAVLNGS